MKKVNDATVEIYMQEYSKEDIKAMLAFYNSPVGKKMAEKAIVVNGLAKNNKLETIGFVIFKPKKLHNKAKNIMSAIIITFKKLTFIAFPIFSCFLAAFSFQLSLLLLKYRI